MFDTREKTLAKPKQTVQNTKLNQVVLLQYCPRKGQKCCCSFVQLFKTFTEPSTQEEWLGFSTANQHLHCNAGKNRGVSTAHPGKAKKATTWHSVRVSCMHNVFFTVTNAMKRTETCFTSILLSSPAFWKCFWVFWKNGFCCICWAPRHYWHRKAENHTTCFPATPPPSSERSKLPSFI